ncbi:MAG: preprotein translocase subunit TatC [Candidatus Brocadia sapporoensis]|nr:MAG: preprotein translocase subunit TatC [Candidatus Brocadia sapporoensis]
MRIMSETNDQKNILPDAEIDLGEMGCGDLIIALMKALKLLKDGQVMKVRSLDSGAQADIPSWCRMRGHVFLAGPCGENNEYYYIKKGGCT